MAVDLGEWHAISFLLFSLWEAKHPKLAAFIGQSVAVTWVTRARLTWELGLVHAVAESKPVRPEICPDRIMSAPEVTRVSKHGLWLLLVDEGQFLPFEYFPWFRQATIDQLSQVEWPASDHLYWPQLDIDVCVESIQKPAAFPLLSK